MSAVARLAPQGAQRWMLDVQLQGEEEEEREEEGEEVRRGRGTERQAGQRRRWREGREDGEGGLEVQFCVFGIASVSFVDGGEAEKGGGWGEGGDDIHDKQSSRTSDNRSLDPSRRPTLCPRRDVPLRPVCAISAPAAARSERRTLRRRGIRSRSGESAARGGCGIAASWRGSDGMCGIRRRGCSGPRCGRVG